MSIIDPITSVELYIQRRRMKTQFDVTHTKKPRQISQYVFYFSLTRQKHKGLISINSNYKTLKLQIKFSKRNSPIVSSISQHSYLQWLFQFEANEPFLGLVMPTQLQNIIMQDFNSINLSTSDQTICTDSSREILQYISKSYQQILVQFRLRK